MQMSKVQKTPAPKLSISIWKPLSVDTVKINIDVALSSDDRWGFGIVCRNSDGQLLAAAARTSHGVEDAALAEGMALLSAIILAMDLSLSKIDFDSDCLNLIAVVVGPGCSNMGYLGQIAESYKKLTAYFVFTSLNHISRSANLPAHLLTKLP